jgi:hypothetical protein
VNIAIILVCVKRVQQFNITKNHAIIRYRTGMTGSTICGMLIALDEVWYFPSKTSIFHEATRVWVKLFIRQRACFFWGAVLL